LNAKAAPHLEFAPPPQPGASRAWLTAGLVHTLLFLALGLATAWKTQPPTVQAVAELWSATPEAAAPLLQEPTPEPQPTPEPTPIVKPSAPPPPPPASDTKAERRDAQIALDKKKQQEKKKEAEKLKAEKEKTAKDKAEKEKAELQRKEREKEREKEDNAKNKAAKENKAQEEKERDKKKAADKASADKADAARADALRQENLKRMQGMAGASGGDNASAVKSSGPSASYAGRLVGRIKPNITYTGDVGGNPRAEVEVKVAPDGTILSRRIVQTSGNKAWDDAVLRAIDKTSVLPRDIDGRVPPVIVLGFRLLD
jgi:colicin import membrane protein